MKKYKKRMNFFPLSNESFAKFIAFRDYITDRLRKVEPFCPDEKMYK